MADTTFEAEKDALIHVLTEVYVRGDMEMTVFENAVARIHACGEPGDLAAEAGALGLSLPPAGLRAGSPAASGEAIEMNCASGSIRKSGDWVASGSYRLKLRSSSVRLDLREYADATGFRLVLDLDATSSVVSLTVPKNFEVEDRLAERTSSAVRNKPKGRGYGGNRIVLTGNIRSSVVKVKYR
ncbi:MAG: hypothetical protein M0Z80_00695 [Treponema sp.]|nr:hypothetical protein [Treponema sp.]